jgi:hypothetical protein
MLTISKNNIDYIFICIILLFSTSANIYLSGIPGCILLFACTLSFQFIQERKILISSKFALFIGLLSVYFGLLSFLHHQLEYYKFICYFTYSYAAYATIRIVSDKLLFYLETAITMFAYISVFFFLWQLVNPASLFYIAKLIGTQYPDALASSEYRFAYNILVYSINSPLDGSFTRNCGLFFEPGLHACILCLALALNIMRNNLKFERRFFLLTYVLLTTFSTTGFIIYLFILMVAGYNRSKKYSFLFLPLLTLILLPFLYSDFFILKITNDFEQMINYEQVFQLAKESDSLQTPGRLISLRLAFIDFQHHPFWGGGTKVSSLSDLYGGEVMLVSGFAMLLVYYGISMAIIWIYGFYRFSIFVRSFYQVKGGKYLLFFVLLLISLSYEIEFPLFFIIATLPFFHSYEHKTIPHPIKNKNEYIASYI